jgi:hypothetical protein
VRFDLFDRRGGVPLDAYDRQNDHRRRFVGLGAAEAYNAPVIGEFYDVAHQPPSSGGQAGFLRPDPLKSASSPIKPHARLTLR